MENFATTNKAPAKHIGVTRTMDDGNVCTCIDYRTYQDCDFQFEDGTMIHGVAYGRFVAGNLKKPKDRVGVTKIMRNGESCTCVAYNGYQCCDFRFESGKIRKNVSWALFSEGRLSSKSNRKLQERNLINERTGKTLTMKDGYSLTCIEYRDSKNADFQYEDGTTLYNIPWYRFKSGLIQKNGRISRRNEREGATKRMLNGELATCIAYRSSLDCDFRFENGLVLTTRWARFAAGTCGTRQFAVINSGKAGISKTMHNGMKATCIAYRGNIDCDFQFEDGTIVEHRNWRAFVDGNIGHPGLYRDKRVGEKRQMRNGKYATCIAYRNFSDCDFQFEDGRVVEHRMWKNFLDGLIAHPNRWRSFRNKRIGEKARMSNGMMCTCVAYRSSMDCDFRFEDDCIVTNKAWGSFKQGYIKHPNKKLNCRIGIERVGVTKTMKNGKKCTCISYQSATDCDFQFEDGYIVKGRHWCAFVRGYIGQKNAS